MKRIFTKVILGLLIVATLVIFFFTFVVKEGYNIRRMLAYKKRKNIENKKSTHQSPKPIVQGKYNTTYQSPLDYIPLALGTRFQIGPDAANQKNRYPKYSETADICSYYNKCVAKNGVDACSIYKTSYC
jgi:hypothetical protein